jgi:hypothetical protein
MDQPHKKGIMSRRGRAAAAVLFQVQLVQQKQSV